MELKGARSAVRRVQAQIASSDNPEDKLRWSVLDGQQLAYKVSMNSLYGFTSAFILNLQQLSAVVTARGRQMITRCVRFANHDFQAIADVRRWTREDVTTWITPSGKEEMADEGGKGWVRKYPAAVEGKPWSWGKSLGARVLGGDTDSIFCNFENCDKLEAFSVGRKMGEVVTEEVFNRKPIELEMEKLWDPMLIQGKKQYVGLKYENDDVKFKKESKGLATKRRNYCEEVKVILWKVIDGALGVQEKDGKLQLIPVKTVNRADLLLEILDDALKAFVSSRSVPWDNLVVTSALRAKYKNENLPHVQFARRMNDREKGGGPRVGQRFGYVFVHRSKLGDDDDPLAEDPAYAETNGLLPHKGFYLNHQIRGPLTTLLNVVNRGPEAEAVFNKFSTKLHDDARARRFLREREARRRLLAGLPPEEVSPLKKATVKTKMSKLAEKEHGKTLKITDFFGRTQADR